MTFESVRDIVKGIPYISADNARVLYDHIIQNGLKNCLELGFAHGAASCYMAAALDEIDGQLTSVDLLEAREWQKPSIEDLLRQCGLSHRVTVVREQTGYNWFLHDEIKRRTSSGVCSPHYDFCVIDGPKNWTIDGCAFFLVDKLLKHYGWIVFDDYNWTYARVDKRKNVTDGITHRSLSPAELKTPHIREVFELLVKQHPDYGQFIIHGLQDWAWAQKIQSDEKKVVFKYDKDYKDIFGMVVMEIRKLFK